MYVDAGIDVEEPCYDYEHIKKVLGEIKKNFEGYFQRFLETNAPLSEKLLQTEKQKNLINTEEISVMPMLVGSWRWSQIYVSLLMNMPKIMMKKNMRTTKPMKI